MKSSLFIEFVSRICLLSCVEYRVTVIYGIVQYPKINEFSESISQSSPSHDRKTLVNFMQMQLPFRAVSLSTILPLNEELQFSLNWWNIFSTPTRIFFVYIYMLYGACYVVY